MTNEPIAYINLDEQRLEFASPFEFNRSAFKQGKIPLYLHPQKTANHPAMQSDRGDWAKTNKSLNGDQMLEGFAIAQDMNPDYKLSSFAAGVRFAEKHHGIGEKE